MIFATSLDGAERKVPPLGKLVVEEFAAISRFYDLPAL